MFIIDLIFITFFLKFIFLFVILKYNINFKKKLLHYIGIDIYSHVIALSMTHYHCFDDNFIYIFYKSFGMILLYWQLYSFYMIIKRIIQQKVKVYYLLIALSFFTGFTKIIVKIIFSLQNKLQLTHMLYQSKVLFVLTYIFYMSFQMFYIIPIMIEGMIYVVKYKINGKIKKLLYGLFIIFFIKTIVENFQVGFLEFFQYFIKSNLYYRSLVERESNSIFVMVSLCSVIFYMYIIFFLERIKIIIEQDYNFSFLKKNSRALSIEINKDSIQMIMLKDEPLKNFITDIVIKNIEKKYKLKKGKVKIISINDFTYAVLFQENKLFYKTIAYNKIIYYDLYYDLYVAYFLINDNEDYIKTILKDILSVLEHLSIKLIIPIYIKNNITDYLIIEMDAFVDNYFLTQEDFSYFFSLINYLEEAYENLQLKSFYSKLLYEKKIAELNLFEHSSMQENSFQKLNEKIQHIEMAMLHENKKKQIKVITKKNTLINIDYVKDMHKKKCVVDQFDNQVFSDDDIDCNNDMTYLSTQKIILNNDIFSFYIMLPRLKKKDGLIEFFLNNEKIDLLFSYNEGVFEAQKKFFTLLFNNFTIKIIISKVYYSIALKKIILYISGAYCIEMSLAFYFKKKNIIFDLFNSLLLQEGKLYYIFFTHVTPKLIIIQKKIIEMYFNYIIQAKNITIKIFFVLEDEQCINALDVQIIKNGSVLFLKELLVSEISDDILVLLLKNYSNLIVKKEYQLDIIKKVVEMNKNNYLNSSIYIFIDFFMKTIDIYLIKLNHINELDNYNIEEAVRLEHKALENIFLMKKIGVLYDFNVVKIAKLLNVNKSTISRYYQKNKIDFL